MRTSLVITFAIDGDLRFISHLDTVRLLERALARAEIPLRYSEGFNPRPRLSLPLPRSVGVASDDETLIVECDEAVTVEDMRTRLSAQLPDGIRLIAVRTMAPRERLVPARVTYRVAVNGPAEHDVADRAAGLMSRARIDVERRDAKTGESHRLDIRPCLLGVRAESGFVEWTQAVLSHGSARPGEVLAAIGLDADEWLHRVRRIRVEYA
ncbi:MAG: TIGR03936 family radical SAM-associated protein [Phycisphaerae bacterium]